MSAPVGEEAIYAAKAKKSEIRLALELDYPIMSAVKIDDFSGGINPEDWWYLALAPDVLLTDGDGVHFRSWGGPPFEVMRTRETWFPDDPTHPFRFAVQFTFPQEDPVYSPLIIIGGLENRFGDLNEPVMIMHQGSATGLTTGLGEVHDGEIRIYCDNQISPVHEESNDQASHFLEIEWDPALAVNASRTTVKFDTNVIYESDDSSRPYYMAAGWTWPVLVDPRTELPVEPIGSIQSPVDVMILEGISIEELGSEGYETRTYPGWTTANDGGNLTTAEEGERFTLNDRAWAKLPVARVMNLQGDKGRSVLVENLSFSLHASDIDGDPNIFLGQRLVGRQLLLDTRTIASDTDTASAWRRQGSFRIKDVRTVERDDGIFLELSCRADIADKLDTFVSIAFLGELQAEDFDGNDFPINITISELLETTLEVANSVAGSAAEVLYDVKLIDIQPDTLNSGGQSLLPMLEELVDQCAYEYFIRYTTSDHGIVYIHAWNLGTGTGAYTFEGANGLTPSVAIYETEGDAPNQANYRQNLPLVDSNEAVNAKGVMTPGIFPSHPYPSRGRPLIDSLTFARALDATGETTLVDEAGDNITGGIAAHKYRLSNTARRTIELTVVGHDWIEPSDEISIDRPGIVVDTESWVIENIGYEYAEDGTWRTTLSAVTSDWLEAIRRTL